MWKKNMRPLRDSEVENALSTLIFSSEDEDSDDEMGATDSYQMNLNHRLDELQQISIEDLHSLLVNESEAVTEVQESVDQPTINNFLSQIQETQSSSPAPSLTQDVSMPEVEVYTTPILLDQAQTSSSSSVPDTAVSELHVQNITEPTLPFNRQIFAQLQNKTRNWSSLHEDITWPVFQRKMQLIKNYTNRSQPIDYFVDLFPEELIAIMVNNTNIYANHTQSKSWTNITREEMKTYLGMIILMSINPLPDINLYWSSDEFYKNPVISRAMPVKRFKKITENLHISDITSEAPRSSANYNKLAKVQPAIDILNKKFKENVLVSDCNSIDECMIKFKGRSSMKQYMPKKPIKRGYKCWARADSVTGYLYEFQIYTGKVDSTTEENLGARVILDLSESLPRHTLVAFDNFFTSLPLLEILYEREIYAVGTIRTNRKGLPDLLTGKNQTRETKKETALKPGEFIYQYCNPISVHKWKDTKDVFVASTAFDPRSVESIQRRQKDGTQKQMYCPLAIKNYTHYMGGVDHFDHFRASYPLGRKSRKSWHRLFWFLCEAAVVNSYIIYMTHHSERRNTHKEFRLRLGRGLINNYSSRKCLPPIFKTKRGGINSVPDEIRKANVGMHMPSLGKFRRCRVCSTRAKEQRTKYFCDLCNIPLCAAPCFYNFHNSE